MLSDEEKKVIKNIKKEFEKNHILPDIANEDLGTLLNLIEKQSKEIEELQVNNKKLQDKCKELIFEKQGLTSALLDSTPKDKIKAKIEEMDNIISQNEEIIFNGRYEHLHTLTEARIVKGEMQSLLGKE